MGAAAGLGSRALSFAPCFPFSKAGSCMAAINSVAECVHLTLSWIMYDNFISYESESVELFGLLNSATTVRCTAAHDFFLCHS